MCGQFVVSWLGVGWRAWQRVESMRLGGCVPEWKTGGREGFWAGVAAGTSEADVWCEPEKRVAREWLSV